MGCDCCPGRAKSSPPAGPRFGRKREQPPAASGTAFLSIHRTSKGGQVSSLLFFVTLFPPTCALLPFFFRLGQRAPRFDGPPTVRFSALADGMVMMHYNLLRSFTQIPRSEGPRVGDSLTLSLLNPRRFGELALPCLVCFCSQVVSLWRWRRCRFAPLEVRRCFLGGASAADGTLFALGGGSSLWQVCELLPCRRGCFLL